MSNESSPQCPQCGTPLPADALKGLCPKCIMALNLQTETVFTDAVPAAQPPLPPEQIAAHFPQLEILECLGRGGMGVVYQARQKTLNRLVALKLLAPERASDPQFAARFEKEARALALLNHPNIVTIYDHGQAGGFYYLLMEFVDGVTLRQLLAKERVSPREALAIVPQICDALQFAHDQGIVHRDIKPENILLDRRGRVKVADFGLAKMVGDGALLTPSLSPSDGERVAKPGEGTPVLTESGKVMGTPHYMSPEQIHAPGEVNHRADIYALGVVFYQMLTGELPGTKIEPPSKKVAIDVRLDEVVLRALEKKPELRFQQASILKTQIETIASSSGDTPPETARIPKGIPILRWRDRWIWDTQNVLWMAFPPALVSVLATSILVPCFGAKCLLALIPGGMGLLFAAIYGLVGSRVRRLKASLPASDAEVTEALIFERPKETPGIAVFYPDRLELFGVAVISRLVVRLDELASFSEVRLFNGRMLWWKSGFVLDLKNGRRIGVAVPEPFGRRWRAKLGGGTLPGASQAVAAEQQYVEREEARTEKGESEKWKAESGEPGQSLLTSAPTSGGWPRFARAAKALVAFLVIIGTTLAVFTIKNRFATPSVELSQAQFLEKFAANQIVEAKVVVNQQSLPLEDITGTFRPTRSAHATAEKDGNPAMEGPPIPFIVHNAWLTQEQLNQLAHSPKITNSAPNTVVRNLFWSIAPFLVLGTGMSLVLVMILYAVWRAANKGVATPPGENAPKTSTLEAGARTIWHPWPLIVLAGMFIIYGCSSAWQLAHDLLGSIFNPNAGFHFFLAVLGIPIGVGLIRRRSWARIMALAAVWGGFATIFVLTGLALTAGIVITTMKLVWLGHEIAGPAKAWFGLLCFALFLGLLVWAHRVLTRSDVKIQFRQAPRAHPWLEWGILAGALMLAMMVSWLGLTTGLDRLNSTLTAANFGAEVERAVYVDQPQNAFLDLATGKFIAAPNDTEPLDWMRASPKAVVHARADFGKASLVSCNMWSGKVGSETWNKPWLLNEMVAQLLTTNQLEMPNYISYWGAERVPATFAFHSADHLTGLLQITGFTDNPRGLKLRYKLVQNEGPNTVAEDKLTETAPSTSTLPTSAFQIRSVVDDSESPEPAETVTNSVGGGRFEMFRLQRAILLDGKAVASAGWRAAEDRTNLVIGLTEEGSREFKALTAANLHRRIAMVFQGRILFAPVIQAAISSRTLDIPVNWDMKELERTMNGLNQMKQTVVDLHFGPEQENVLPQLNGNYLNLRANSLLATPISDLGSRALHEWQRQNGADLAAAPEEKIPVLLAFGMAVVPAMANGLENNSPSDIWYNWNLMVNEPEARTVLAKAPAKGRDTFFFRTRDDAWGELQITGFAEHPRGVRIRYKLAQPGQPSP